MIFKTSPEDAQYKLRLIPTNDVIIEETFIHRINRLDANLGSVPCIGEDCPLCRVIYDNVKPFKPMSLIHAVSKRPVYKTSVVVLDDPIHPENNGRIFTFKFGKMLLNLIKNDIADLYGEKKYKPLVLDVKKQCGFVSFQDSYVGKKKKGHAIVADSFHEETNESERWYNKPNLELLANILHTQLKPSISE